jgi:hypothetical protein
MGKLSEQEDTWQTEATAAAVAEARAIAQSQLANGAGWQAHRATNGLDRSPRFC